MHSLLFTISLVAALLWHAPHASAAMTRQDIIDLHEQSLGSLHKGDSARAYAGSLRLLREDPGNADVDFMVGQAAFAQGNYPMALLAYARVIKANPGHERARLELARTYGRMGQREMARTELNALRAVNPALPKIEEMEKSIFEAPYSPWTFRATLGTGAFYDSNANQGASASEYMGSTLAQEKKKESFGIYFSGGVDLAYRLGRETNWYVVGDVSATNRQYFNPDVDPRLTWGRAGLGLRWASDNLLAEIRGKGEYLGREAGAIAQNVGAEGTFVYALNDSWAFVTEGSYEYRGYADDYKGMRGTYGQVGQYVRYRFGERQHEVLLGGNYFFESAHEKRYTGRGFEALGRVQFNLPWQIKTGFLFAWRAPWYDAPPTDLGGGKRWESQIKAGIEIEKGITEYLSLNTQVQYTNNFSNHSLYRYDQWLLTLGLTFSF